MRRNDKVALIVLSIAMVVVGLYLLSVVSAWFWAITLWQWVITVRYAIPGAIWSIIVWVLSAAFWVLAIVGLALTISGAFLLWKHAAPPDRPVRRTILILAGLLVLGVVFLVGSWPQPGHVQDEAMRAGVPASSFEAAADNYFDGMDPGVKLSEPEIKGRNVWLVWTGGNDRFWDTIIKDFLRDLRPSENHFLGARADLQPRQSMEIFRHGQRALLRQADPTRPASLWFVARPATRRLSA